jgi:hypothetical protein
MKMNRIASLLMFCVTLWFCVLCTRCTDNQVDPDPDPGPNGPGLGEGQVSLKIVVPRGSISTYADTNASTGENHIDTLFVDLYEGGTSDSYVIKKDTFLAGDLQQTDSIVTIKYTVDNIKTGKVLAKVYANRKEVKKITGEIPIPDESDMARNDFFMSGEDSLKFEGSSYVSTIHVIRNVAKVRVNISKNDVVFPSDLEIEYDKVKIQVLTVPDLTSPFFQASGFDPDAYINYSERAGTSLRESPTKFSDTDGGQIDSFYIYENFLSSYGDTTITKVKVTIPTYSPTEGAKSAEYTYFLYTPKDGYKLRRNYIYTLDIKVRGQSLEPVITVSILPWKDVNIPGDIHGTYLTTDPAEILFDSKGEATVNFCTDAQAVYFNFEDFKTTTGKVIGVDITTEGIDTTTNVLAPEGFKDGYILLDQQHCGSFKLKLVLAKFPEFPEINFSGRICMKIGNIERCLTLSGQRTYDAHFIVGDSIFALNDTYTAANVYEDDENNKKPGWLYISINRFYNSTDMTASYSGSSNLYLHLDENLTGVSRTGTVVVTRDNGAEQKLRIKQLPAIPVGRFGYNRSTVPGDDSIYTAMLYVEQLREFNTMLKYKNNLGTGFTINNAIYNGHRTAKSVFDRDLYNANFNYQDAMYQAINYCAHKNRIPPGSNLDSELKWYLPAQAQLLGMWLSYNSYDSVSTSNFMRKNTAKDNDFKFWSSTENSGDVSGPYTDAQYINFLYGNVGHRLISDQYWARCVRDSVEGSPMVSNTSFSYPVIDFEKGMPQGSLTAIPKPNGAGGDENSDNNKTLFKRLRVAKEDLYPLSEGIKWSIDTCAKYTEDNKTWRLPTQRELQAIWILQSEIKREYPNDFQLLEDKYYWSATDASGAAATNAWTVFGSRNKAGSSGNAPHQPKYEQLRVRCVREE